MVLILKKEKNRAFRKKVKHYPMQNRKRECDRNLLLIPVNKVYMISFPFSLGCMGFSFEEQIKISLI